MVEKLAISSLGCYTALEGLFIAISDVSPPPDWQWSMVEPCILQLFRKQASTAGLVAKLCEIAKVRSDHLRIRSPCFE